MPLVQDRSLDVLYYGCPPLINIKSSQAFNDTAFVLRSDAHIAYKHMCLVTVGPDITPIYWPAPLTTKHPTICQESQWISHAQIFPCVIKKKKNPVTFRLPTWPQYSFLHRDICTEDTMPPKHIKHDTSYPEYISWVFTSNSFINFNSHIHHTAIQKCILN